MSNKRSVINLLERTHDLLRRIQWVKGQWAVDRKGKCVPSRSKKAVGYCLLGALNANTRSTALFTDAIIALKNQAKLLCLTPKSSCMTFGVPSINDNLKRKRQVFMWLRRTIASLSAKPT